MYASQRSTLKVSPPHHLWCTESTFAIFCWIDYATFVMRRRHPDWKCKGNRNVTREPEKSSVVRRSLPDCRNEKSSLMNLSTFLYFPIFSNRCFFLSLFSFRVTRLTTIFRFSPSCKLAHPKMHYNAETFGKKIWPHKRKIVGNQSLDYEEGLRRPLRQLQHRGQ